jgi:hypothetical protein
MGQFVEPSHHGQLVGAAAKLSEVDTAAVLIPRSRLACRSKRCALEIDGGREPD